MTNADYWITTQPRHPTGRCQLDAGPQLAFLQRIACRVAGLFEPSLSIGLSALLLQAKVREFCQKYGEPIIGAWDLAAVRGEHNKARQFLKDLMKAANEYGILPATVGTPWPKEHTTAEAPANYCRPSLHSLLLCNRAGSQRALPGLSREDLGLDCHLCSCLACRTTPRCSTASSKTLCPARK